MFYRSFYCILRCIVNVCAAKEEKNSGQTVCERIVACFGSACVLLILVIKSKWSSFPFTFLPSHFLIVLTLCMSECECECECVYGAECPHKMHLLCNNRQEVGFSKTAERKMDPR